MGDPLEAFEAELRNLSPVEPSPDLTRRIESALPRVQRRSASAWWVATLALPVAALVAFLVARAPRAGGRVIPGGRSAAASIAPAALLKPVAAANVLYAARDEGTVILADGTRARRERYEFVDTITWQNPRTHASLTWSLPREEVRITPVTYQ